MKKSLLTVLVFGVFAIVAQSARAQMACGGNMMYNNDCDNSRRHWHFSCCPEGTRAQGVAYTDIKGQDHVDAVSVVCRSITRGNDVVPQDFRRTPKQFVCEKAEVLSGIYCKDVLTHGGDKRDTLDGCTAICEQPGNPDLRKIYNVDIQGGREGREMVARLPKHISGIAYKELDNGGDNAGGSDRADCATIIVK